MAYLIGFGKVCLYSLKAMTGLLKVHPFFCFVHESCSCPLCVVTGAHAAIFQLRNVSKKCFKKYSKIGAKIVTKIFKQNKFVKKFTKFT